MNNLFNVFKLFSLIIPYIGLVKISNRNIPAYTFLISYWEKSPLK